MRNIKDTKITELCTGCGTCAGICPNSAIKMIINSNGVYSPQISNGKCINCGICFDACPAYFGMPSIIDNQLNCYLGNSINSDIRFNSTSGGLITQLLIFALENKTINGVLVTKMDEFNPLRPRPFIARTVNEIIDASKSKYCPVPLNIMIGEILQTKEGDKIAIVGLPCHIHGIRKAENINEILKNKVVLHFGLFCNHAPTFFATEFLLEQKGINKEEVLKLDYRGKGWPGGMSIILKDKSEIFVPYFSSIYWGVAFNLFFFPRRCTLCSDKLNELADLSFGDAWLPDLENDDLGTSIVVARNKTGEFFLDNAFESGVIQLKKIEARMAFTSQSIAVVNKRVKARRTIFRIFGKETPSTNHVLPVPNFVDYVIVVIFYVLNNILSRKYLWKLTKICSITLGPMRNFAKSILYSSR